MWWGSGSDPGGPSGAEGPKELPPNQEEMQERYEQQQILLSQLKEMLRKSEQSSSVSRERVEEYSSTLNEINARTKLSKIRRSEGKKNDPDDGSSKPVSSSKKSNITTPAKEKINLLRQQLEENRAKLAERDKNKKDIEEMVNQLKAQLDDSQLSISESQPDKKLITASLTSESSKEDLLSAIKCKDDHITELTGKVQQLQANVLDLQENIKEKDSVIDARTKAITLLSENLSKKGKNTLDMLDETKEQMRNMQQNFVELEANMKNENVKLQSELTTKEKTIQELLENNNALETTSSDLQSANLELQSRLTTLDMELEKYKLHATESENKIQELKEINEEFQNKLSQIESSETQKCEPSTPQKTSKRTKGKNKKSSIPEPESVEAPHLNRIAELEKQDEEFKSKSGSYSKQEIEGQKDHVIQLNKQLDDLNKNMIKMKAQHKAKLKEIQKKTSPSELSEKVATLESENVKLCQRVAGLEDEKGNLQLRLVDLESNKDKEYIADLENKSEEQKQEIENHIRTIKALESKITTISNEMSSLNSEVSNFMHLENAQVCSEMTSVQLEEQLDKEVSQKKEIQDKYNGLIKENETLLEKIELLNKEKQELSTKLDNYMQENIELIDRLEKLSAEKVSSAESIEIVESLTQQEKLEIEAYQQQLDYGTEKQPEGNSEHEHQELDTKLTEETSPSELIERIELFTVERREVMDKMDNLATENQQLHNKFEKLEEKYERLSNEKETMMSRIDQLSSENNELLQKIKSREELGNENLQEQVTEYRALLENQKLQIASLQEELWNKPDSDISQLQELNETLNNQVVALQKQHDALLNDYQNIKGKYNEKELHDATNKIIELENKMTENNEEIYFLQSNIEDNKTELVRAAEKIAEFDKSIEMKNAEVETQKNEIEELQQIIVELNGDLENREHNKQEEITVYASQLEEFKNILSEHIEQLQHYESEIKQNSQTIEILNDQIEELNYKIIESQHEMEMKNAEILTLNSVKSDYKTKIKSLEEELQEKNNNFSETCRQLKEKCKFLENQIETNTGSIEDIKVPFETKIKELEKKNKDQVEKMKKIAANLKKKTAICQELETKLSDIKEKWENESKEKDEKQKIIHDQHLKLKDNEKKLNSILIQLQELEAELGRLQKNEDSKTAALVHQKENYNLQIEKIMSEKTLLENKLQEFVSINTEILKLRDELSISITQQTSLQEVILGKDHLIESLNAEINTIKFESTTTSNEIIHNLSLQIEEIILKMETSQNAMEAKLQEKDMYIENLEADNYKYKEKVYKLEEGLSNIEERRQMLEERAVHLKVQLEEKSNACEEASQSEDFLERRLSALIAHDELIEQKLQQTTLENQTLNIKANNLIEENIKLQTTIKEIQIKLQESSQNEDKVEQLENECSRLTKVIINLENDTKKLQSDHEAKLNEKLAEIESMETELNSQLQELHAERKNILNRCEILEDNIKEYVENEQQLNEEINQLQDKLSVTQQVLELRVSENQEMHNSKTNHLFRIEQLETQLLNLQNIQSTTVDLQSLQTELDNLKILDAQKELELKSKLSENDQLGNTISNNLTRIEQLENQLLNLQNVPYPSIDVQSLQTELDRFQKLVTQKDIDIQNYQRQNMQLQMAASFTSTPTTSSNIFDLPTSETDHLRNSLSESNSRCVSLEQQIHDITEQLKQAQIEINQSEKNKSMYVTLEQQIYDITEQLNQARLELNKSQENTNEIQQFYQVAQQELEVQKLISNNLQQELANQTELFIRKTAEDNVTQIISTAEQTISQEMCQQPIVEIDLQKQETSILTSQKPIESMTEEESKEELLRKIKALEFMLFNIEKEKDDTLTHCHEFTNELTRLVYEREHLLKHKRENKSVQSEPHLLAVENQIVSSETNEKKLHEYEFPSIQVQINKDIVDNIPVEPQPIAEEMIKPKTSYLCYTDAGSKTDPNPKRSPSQHQEEAWGWATEDQILRDSIESQIVSMEQIKITPEDKKLFQQMEYGKVEIPKDSTDHTVPVNEMISDPKPAYLCYPTESSKNVDTFASEEDGWGWNAEEAKLEAEHRQSLGVLPSVATDSRVEQLEERIHDLEVERSRLLDEVKTNQVRSGKLIKKMKLMKESYEKSLAETTKNKSADDFGLDMAIQDELNNQIKTLEKKIKEMSEENMKDKAEKDNLLMRLDVLQSANERMIEIKEKADNEMHFLQFTNRELSSKIEQLAWGDDSPYKSATNIESSTESDVNTAETKRKCEELTKEISSLQATINDLTLDNDEMQLLLEEQRRLRIEAEKAKLNIRIPENMKTDQEYLKVENENHILQAEVNNLNEIKQTLEDKITKNVQQNEELSAKANHLQLNIENLIQENNVMNNQAQLRVEQLQNEYIELQNQLSVLNTVNENLKQNQIDSYNSEIVHLREEILKLENGKRDLESVYIEKEAKMKNQIEMNESEMSKLKDELLKLQSERNLLEINLAEREVCVLHLNSKIQQLESEKSVLDIRLQDILNIQTTDKTNDEKLRQMNEQLMVSIAALESKNKELSDINNALNIEKLDSEQKMSVTIEQLAQEWSQRVDQRGYDVAESWKLHLESIESEYSQRELKLKADLDEIFIKNEEIIVQNNELQKEVDIIVSEKQEFVFHNNNIIQTLQQSMNDKQAEILELAQKLHQMNTELEEKNRAIISLKQSSELMQIKEIELEEAATQLDIKMTECKDLEEQLEIKNEACKDLEIKLNELNILSEDETNQIADLRNIIENQVLKIEKLKKELENKNNDYNTLLAEFDNFERIYLKGEPDKPEETLIAENFATEAQVLRPETEQANIEIDNANAPVNRAELDLALYMLHQRDVRCEELTVELMQLLEERDTLQLKLSNAIRWNEELRVNTNASIKQENKQDTSKVVKSTGAIPKTKAIVLGATGTELATEAIEIISAEAMPSENKDVLDLKLSELRSVGYRDKTLKDDQENRHIQQLSLMQQHRDIASKLPPEAAARLVDANYTLSRDVQSPSKVLLNWLWGRSTPKVNDV